MSVIPHLLRDLLLTISSLLKMVGMTGFEPAAPTSRTWCATKLRYIPVPKARHYSEYSLPFIIFEKRCATNLSQIDIIIFEKRCATNLSQIDTQSICSAECSIPVPKARHYSEYSYSLTQKVLTRYHLNFT